MNVRQWLAVAFVVSTFIAKAVAMGIMVPAYFYPSGNTYWNSLDATAALVPVTVIINPNSGPGASRDTTYVQALSKLHQAGGKVIAYVSTAYTARVLGDVEADINTYLAWYVVDGFFIDEMTNDGNTNHLNYYATIYQYIKAKGTNYAGVSYSVTGNPGANTQEAYLTQPTADCLMIFETDTGYGNYKPSSWVNKYPAADFVNVVYGVTNTTTLSNYVNLAASRNIGWIYFTDDVLPNPYDTLPSYLTGETTLVRSINLTPPGPLAVKAAGESAVISWPGTGTLQWAGALTNGAAWNTVTGASSPYSTMVSNPRQFYRLSQ